MRAAWCCRGNAIEETVVKEGVVGSTTPSEPYGLPEYADESPVGGGGASVVPRAFGEGIEEREDGYSVSPSSAVAVAPPSRSPLPPPPTSSSSAPVPPSRPQKDRRDGGDEPGTAAARRGRGGGRDDGDLHSIMDMWSAVAKSSRSAIAAANGDAGGAGGGKAAAAPSPTVASLPPRDSAKNLGTSLREAWERMAADNPDAAEENEIRRAIELSLLDCALVYRGSSGNGGGSGTAGGALAGHPNGSSHHDAKAATVHPPHEVLGVGAEATPEEIRAAYRRKALVTHPDKGGEAGQFERVALAYRSLLASSRAGVGGSSRRVVGEENGEGSAVAQEDRSATGPALKSTAHWDAELKGHRDVVAEMFAGTRGADVTDNAERQKAVRAKLGLRHKEAGASNRNERNERIRNSCFYLSLAVSYLGGIGALMSPAFGSSVDDGDDGEALRAADEALISQTALQLKRTIEGAVIAAHPEWATQGMVGEEVQAFSDFLVYTLESDTILRDWAVAVFDETSGFVDVYKGRNYGGGSGGNKHAGDSEGDWARRANTLTLRFVPGHYQPLLPVDADRRPSLDEILAYLDRAGVFYVVTDGAA